MEDRETTEKAMEKDGASSSESQEGSTFDKQNRP